MKQEIYTLGDSDSEVYRLGYQHQFWAKQARIGWKDSGFSPKQRLLDAGCGPGFTTLELARIVGEQGKVYALDNSPKYLKILEENLKAQRLSNVQILEEDIREFSWEEEPLDGIYARMVFLFMSEPEKIMAKFYKALKPNGVLFINDFTTYRFHFSHKCPLMEKFVLNTPKFISQEIGIGKTYPGKMNIDILNRLPELALKQNFKIKKLQHHSQILRPNEFGWDWLLLFIKNYLPQLVKADLFSEKEATQIFEEWGNFSRQEGAFIITPSFLDTILFKP